MYSCQQQAHKLINLNVRAESIHGEHWPVIDLTVETKESNDVLSEFSPDLKAALYRKADASDTQADLMADEPGYLPSLKFPAIGAIKYGYEGKGYETTVHLGLGGKSDIVLPETTIDKFSFECHDGGTVITKYRIIAHPKTEDIGRLAEMIQQQITLTLEPPKAY